MPPYYPDQYAEQYPYGVQYDDAYNQYQYQVPQTVQYQQRPIPNQVQVNIPPRQQYPPAQQYHQQQQQQQQQQQNYQYQHQQAQQLHQQQIQQQYDYNRNFSSSYASQQSMPFQYQQPSPSQPQYHAQFQQASISPTQSMPQQRQQSLPQHMPQQMNHPQSVDQSRNQPNRYPQTEPRPAYSGRQHDQIIPQQQNEQQPHQHQHQHQPKQQPPQQHQHQELRYKQHNQQQIQSTPKTAFPRAQVQVNIPSKVQSPMQRVLKDVSPSVPRQSQPTVPKQPSDSKKAIKASELSFEILLLSLADEYLEKAYDLPVRSEEYFKLTATALGCIDAALNNYKMTPLREAQVSLKYARLLLNETENYDEAERLLTKVIDDCTRMKYIDLKYAAQLLLVRVLYQSRPKAALKDLQAMIQDVEAYKHVAWEYCFRFQYVMFVMRSSQASDNHTALTQLERICHLAKQAGDNTVLAFAAIIEALAHLAASGAESVSSSQRSVAKARAQQDNLDVKVNPQLCIMIEFVDLCGQIKKSDISQSGEKRKVMQDVLYKAIKSPLWQKDGLMYLLINPSSLRGVPVQECGLVMQKNDKYYIAFSWLPLDETEDLGYLLSGISAAQKNAGDGGKAEKFLEEGVGMIKEIAGAQRPMNSTGDDIRHRLLLVECHFLLETVFMQCAKGNWTKAQSTITKIDSVAGEVGTSFPRELKCARDYLQAAIYQGTGDLEGALNVLQSPVLSIASQLDERNNGKPSGQLHRHDDTTRNFSILAAMNTVFILQHAQQPQHQRIASLISTVDPLASHHPNKSIQAAWNFVLASLPNNTILKTKQYLGNALNIAQSINNAQITTLCLVTMQEKFFKGVVGDQATKCARAASHQAKRLNEPLWVATAYGLEAECLSVHGMADESAVKREEMNNVVTKLPMKVRDKVR